MEEQEIELIERYFRGELTAAERRAFEERRSTDAGFREAVELHGAALEAIRLEGSAALRARLSRKGRELDARAEKHKRRWWWLARLLTLIFLVPAAWWFFSKPAPGGSAPQPQTPSSPVDNRPQVAPTPPDTPAVKAPPVASTEENSPDTRKLFAAAFKPYKDESLEPARRGTDAPTPSEQFQQLYWDGRYADALGQFDALSPAVQNNDNLLFLKANCLLATGRPADAGALLETLLRNDRTRFMDQVNWYLALSRLATGQADAARKQLRTIAADPNAPRQADAERLLRTWK